MTRDQYEAYKQKIRQEAREGLGAALAQAQQGQIGTLQQQVDAARQQGAISGQALANQIAQMDAQARRNAEAIAYAQEKQMAALAEAMKEVIKKQVAERYEREGKIAFCSHTRQFFLGDVMPCAHPRCPEGVGGDGYARAVGQRTARASDLLRRDAIDPRASYVKIMFSRRPQATRAQWEWRAEPSISRDHDPALTKELIAEGWGSALVPEKKALDLSQPDPRHLSAYYAGYRSGTRLAGNLDALERARRNRAEAENDPYYRELGAVHYGVGFMDAGGTARRPRTVRTSAVWNCVANGCPMRSPSEQVQEPGPALAAEIADLKHQIAAAAEKAEVPRIGPVAQHREVSEDGRHWLDYDRLTDPDAFDVYRHRRVDGVVMGALAISGPPVVGKYGPNMRAESRILDALVKSEFVRLPKPRPWTPSVLDEDLLPDV
jgi:hypothetical protein